MLFFEDTRQDHHLTELGLEVASRSAPAINPLPCDRWVARSALQKGCRRGDIGVAIRALANLYEHDRRTLWRHLTIIVMEDVGVANIDLLAKIVAAQRDRTWRQSVGGDWAVFAELTRQAAESNHCQAACDLLLCAMNDPSLQPIRERALEQDMGCLMMMLADTALPITERGVIALAAGGGLAEGQSNHDAAAVFEILIEIGELHIVAACKTAWKMTRNPMAMLLPLICQVRTTAKFGVVVDDPIRAVQLTSQVPGYALDQFTRRGNTVSRTLLSECPELGRLLDAAGVRPELHSRAIGDILFLIEGGLVRNRLLWTIGDELRLPHRWMPSVATLGTYLAQTLSLVEAKASQVAILRQRYLPIEEA